MVGGEFGGRCPPQAWKIAEAGGLQSPGAESLQPAAQRVRGVVLFRSRRSQKAWQGNSSNPA